MGDDIAEPGNLLPVCVRIPFLKIVRESFYRFPDHQEIPDNCIPAPPVRGEFFERDPGCILFDIADLFKDVVKVLEHGPMHIRPPQG